MSRHKSTVTEKGIGRVITAARRAGLEVAQVEVKADGTITIKAAGGDESPPESLDRELAEFEAKHGQG